MSAGIRTRVVKIGGSLLRCQDIVRRIDAWTEAQPPAQRTLYIVGGGAAVDAMRELYAVHGLNEPAMHWRCIRLLTATFEIFAEWKPDWQHVATRESFEQHVRQDRFAEHVLIAVEAFFGPEYDSHLPQSYLPQSWDTTTDAIAAELAHRTQADEVVLLKSCEVPANSTLGELAAQGVVDKVLPEVARGLTVRVQKLSR